MSLIGRLFILLFLIAAGVELTGESLDHKLMIYASKPFLMLLLIGFYNYRVGLKKGFDVLIVLALIFSLMGDVFLMVRPHSEGLFLLGLGSFLIAQIGYAVAFIIDTRTPMVSKWKAMDIVMPFMIITYSTLFALLLVGELEGIIETAVIIYLTGITLMSVSAALRIRDGLTSDRLMVLSGAILFVLSDSLIAISKFFDPTIPYARFMIMLLYIVGQFLIISGCIRYRSPEPEKKDGVIYLSHP